MATDIAMILMGKHRPTYTPHIDTGDYVVVINAEKIVLSGKKWDQKVYTWTTGYPGLKSETARTRFEREPESILIEAVPHVAKKAGAGCSTAEGLHRRKHPPADPQPKELAK
jgi:large subunit ribosomal protein L13